MAHFHMLEWSNEQALQLIQEYEGKPELWDNHDDNYRVQSARFAAWSQLAETFGCDAADVRRKMNSLLTSHRRERWRVANGDGTHWFAYDALAFMEDKYALKEMEEDVNELSDDRRVDVDSTEAAVIKKEPTKPRTGKRRRKFVRQTVKVKTKDACDTFGEYVAHSLRQHDDKTKSIIRHAISDILFEIETQKYNVDFEELEREQNDKDTNCMDEDGFTLLQPENNYLSLDRLRPGSINKKADRKF